jgi:hypothetical protein
MVASLAAACIAAGSSVQTKTFAEDRTTIFAGPERGWYTARYPTDAPMDLTDFRNLRRDKVTVVSYRVHLGAFREPGKPISEEFLELIDRDFRVAMAAGMKFAPLFYYAESDTRPDTTLQNVLMHIAQLKPILRRHGDLIVTAELGFIGAWGEEHSSTHGLTEEPAYTAILDAFLEALPPDRTVLVRYAPSKQKRYGTAPLNASTAWKGDARSRIGHRNMYFCGDLWNGHTYWWDWDGKSWPPDPAQIRREKAWLSQECLYVPNIFEADTGQRTDANGDGAYDAEDFSGAKVLEESRRLRMSLGHNLYNMGMIRRWQLDVVDGDTAYNHLARLLGYRMRLIDAGWMPTVRRGEWLPVTARAVNNGFAAPIQRRPVDLVLRHKVTGRTISFPSGTDTRRWLPARTFSLNWRATVPRSAPAGTYEVLLFLPDASPRLRHRPEFSLRFANVGTWVPTSGFNRLGEVTVE